eukprot:1396169-Amphidinium_carterae.1
MFRLVGTMLLGIKQSVYGADGCKGVVKAVQLVGPQLRVRPDSEPRVRLPAEAPAEDPADSGIVGVVFLEAPCKLGRHLRVCCLSTVPRMWAPDWQG